MPHDVDLWSEAIAHLGHIAHVDRRVANHLTGRLFSSATVRGLALRSTSYSNCPIFAVPDGNTRFCELTAARISGGASPLDWSRPGFKFTITCRCFPPYGNGMEAPGTVTSCVLRKL